MKEALNAEFWKTVAWKTEMVMGQYWNRTSRKRSACCTEQVQD